MNDKKISETRYFKKFSIQFNENIEFLEDFSNLLSFSGRITSFISPEKVYFVPTTFMINNSIKSLITIKQCCSEGSFSDANTVIRKLRDDLLLFVYIFSIVNNRKTFKKETLEKFKTDNVEEIIKGLGGLIFNKFSDDEKAVNAWLNNKVYELPFHIKKKLGYENYMKVLKQNKNVSEILLKYNLKKYWQFLQTKLNDYVHNNGVQFTQHNLIKSNNSNLEIYLQNINTRTSFIISFFLVLITMVDSPLLCSGDIEDYLNLGIAPPENCQYEIAPFIQKYINEKVITLHPELKEYLHNNNSHGMIIK